MQQQPTISELRQRALPREQLADEAGSEAQHGQAPHEQLVGLGEAQLDGEGLAVHLGGGQAGGLLEALAAGLGGARARLGGGGANLREGARGEDLKIQAKENRWLSHGQDCNSLEVRAPRGTGFDYLQSTFTYIDDKTRWCKASKCRATDGRDHQKLKRQQLLQDMICLGNDILPW